MENNGAGFIGAPESDLVPNADFFSFFSEAKAIS